MSTPDNAQTTPTDLDAWTTLTNAMLTGLPLPYEVRVGTRGHQASQFGTIAVSVRTTAEADAWAVRLDATATATVRRFGDVYLYGVWLPGWRGWHELEVSTDVEVTDLTDADRDALGGGR